MSIKELAESNDSKAEKYWVYGFKIIGTVMFLGGIWESLVTAFWLDKDFTTMDSGRIYFALFGFFLAFGGKTFGVIANSIGAKIIEKLN